MGLLVDGSQTDLCPQYKFLKEVSIHMSQYPEAWVQLRDLSATISTTLITKSRWLRGRASHCRLRGPGFKSCAALGMTVFTLHCSSSVKFMNEYLAIDIGRYLYENPSRINYSVAGCFPEKLRRCLIE